MDRHSDSGVVVVQDYRKVVSENDLEDVGQLAWEEATLLRHTKRMPSMMSNHVVELTKPIYVFGQLVSGCCFHAVFQKRAAPSHPGRTGRPSDDPKIPWSVLGHDTSPQSADGIGLKVPWESAGGQQEGVPTNVR